MAKQPKQPRQPRSARQAPKAAAGASGATKNPLVDKIKNEMKDTDDKGLKNDLLDQDIKITKDMTDNKIQKDSKPEKPEKEKNETKESKDTKEFKDHKDHKEHKDSSAKFEKLEGSEGVVKDFTREKQSPEKNLGMDVKATTKIESPEAAAAAAKVKDQKFESKEIEKIKPEHEKAQQKEIEKIKAEHEKHPKEFIKEIDKIKPEHEKTFKDVDKIKPEKEVEKVKAEHEKHPKEFVKEIDKVKPEIEKQLKEKEGKELAETPVDPALSEGVAARGDGDRDHFIEPGQRPDLSGGALSSEADKGKPAPTPRKR